jgi:hypothetical protein
MKKDETKVEIEKYLFPLMTTHWCTEWEKEKGMKNYPLRRHVSAALPPTPTRLRCSTPSADTSLLLYPLRRHVFDASHLSFQQRIAFGDFVGLVSVPATR